MIKRLLGPLFYCINGFKHKFRINKSRKQIKKLQNKYSNKRCFIIGNGPSLVTDDLEKLKNEICFGSHRVYQIFERTDWRPNYYFAQDAKLISDSAKEINEKIKCEKFLCSIPRVKIPKIKNANYIQIFLEDFYPQLPKFSEDMSLGFYEGFTVSYMCLQMAVYMGFKEIYLLGIDHNYSVNMLADGTIAHSDVKDHFDDNDKITNIPQTFKSSLAYVAAAKYAQEHNIKIYNATRGGKLEAFERIDFDKIFFNN